MRTTTSLPTALALLLLANCTTASTGEFELEAQTTQEGDQTGDQAGDKEDSLRVRDSETSVWLESEIVSQARDDRGSFLTLRGRASRDVLDGFGFIFDDPYGEFETRGARSFSVYWSPSEAATLLQGTNQFVRINFKESRGRPSSLTARLTARPTLGGFTGRNVYLGTELMPRLVGGRVIYRLTGELAARAGAVSNVDVTFAGRAHTVVSDGGAKFHADFTLDDLTAALLGDSTVAVSLAGRVLKRARASLSVRNFGLTAADVNEVWPPVTCTPEVSACVLALPESSTDLSSCGEAIYALQCAHQRVIFDETAFQSAHAAADVRLQDTAGFATDMVGLVGDERAVAFQSNVLLGVESALEQMFGRSYRSTEAMNDDVQQIVDATILDAYAYPLNYVDALPAIPGDLDRERNVAADALLGYLAEFDFANSLFDAEYTTVVKNNLAWHVRSIRAFRETATPDPWSPDANWNNYVGEWTSPHVEIRINKTTGEFADILFEID